MDLRSNVLVWIFLSSILGGCSDDGQIIPQDDYSLELENTANTVILKTYENLASLAESLEQSVQQLNMQPDQFHLETAREAWVAARSPWEQSEGFLFGPVDQEGLDPSLDSWPVNVTDLNNLLNSGSDLTIEFLHQQEGTLKGFHTIEYLLWGESGDKQISAFTKREYDYLLAACGALADDAQTLYELWSPTGGNYLQHIVKAGKGSNVYISQKAALEEMANAMIIIADEVANGKINDPLAQQDLSLEESRFSGNSKKDFADNMRSVLNIYLGSLNGTESGKSIAEILKMKDPKVYQEIRAAIDLAISSIEQIPGSFSTAIFSQTAAVETAQTNVRSLQRELEEKLLPIISNL